MASSVSSYFILSPHGPNKMKTEEETNHVKEKASKPGKMDKDSKSKQVILTRNELTRKRMELIRFKLEESRAKYFEKIKDQSLNCSRPIPRVSDVFTPNKEVKSSSENKESGMEMVPISNTSDLPYVYFVVSPDRPVKSSKSSRGKSRSKDRQRGDEKRKQLSTRSTVFASKEDYGITSDNTKIMPLSRNFGIHTESLQHSDRTVAQKQIVFPLPMKMTPKNPPTTPATTILSNSAGHYGSREFDLITDFETIHEKSIKMTICEDNEIIETIHNPVKDIVPRVSSTRSLSTRCLELPFISMDEQRKALGTAGSFGQKSMDFVRKSLISQESSQKRVTFADSVDLPSIKGSNIALSTESLVPYNGPRALTVPDFSSEKSKSVSDLFHTRSLPENRVVHTSEGRLKKNSKHLDLPKIDIVSSVYDELIIKAIEGYIMSLPPYSKQAQVAKQLLAQLENKTLSTADFEKERYRMIREEIANMPRNTFYKKHSKPTPRKIPTEKCYSPLEPKCYRMILPGAEAPIKIVQS